MSLTRSDHPLRVLVIGGVVIVGVSLLIYGGRSQVNGPATIQRNPEIVTLEPNESDQLLPQGEVGAQLRGGLTGQLSIDGRPIPKDQMEPDGGLNEVVFDPGPGKDIQEFTKGGHTAVLEWWPNTIATAEQARAQRQFRSYTWSFNVG